MNEMIHPDAKVPIVKRKVILKEPQAAKSELEISGIPDNAIIIDCDKFKLANVFFNNSKNELQKADYIIIAVKDSNRHIVFIEMKSSNYPKKHEIVNQLRGACCLVEYCKAIAINFWEVSDFLQEYKACYIGFITTSHKTKTKTIKESIHNNTPDKFSKMRGSYVEYNHLVGITQISDALMH